MDADAQLEALTRGTVDVHVAEDLLARLKTGRPLKVKAGFDPTRPDLHLGHTVLMQKMRQFQQLGHEVIFVVGDFTARIGDPTGKSQTRSVPTEAEIEEGARTYAEQAFKVLDRDKTRLVFNSEWLSPMGFADVIRLAGRYRLARMMERDDFKTRWAEHASISIHELLYPLVQAYDSVALECDIELGGTDQLFNLLVGREIMREYGQKPQCVMTTPILEGLGAKLEDGKIVGDKMSKSLDNYVGITEAPRDQLFKLMSITDDVMWRYYELLSEEPAPAIAKMKSECEAGQMNPRDAKLRLAREIVARYHDAKAAEDADAAWRHQFSGRKVPTDLAEVRVALDGEASVWVSKALASTGLVKSSSEARRRIEAGAIQIDGEKVSDVKAELKAGTYVVKAGKKTWAKLIVE